MKAIFAPALLMFSSHLANADVVCSGGLPFGNTGINVKFTIKDSDPLDSTAEFYYEKQIIRRADSMFKLNATTNALFFRLVGDSPSPSDYGANLSIAYPLQLNGETPVAFYSHYSGSYAGISLTRPTGNDQSRAQYAVAAGQIVCK